MYVKEIFGLNKFYIVDLESLLWQPCRTPNPSFYSFMSRIQNSGIFFFDTSHLAGPFEHHSYSWALPVPSLGLLPMHGYEMILELCQTTAFWILKIILMFIARFTTKYTAISLHTTKHIIHTWDYVIVCKQRKKRCHMKQIFFFLSIIWTSKARYLK